MLFRSLQSGNQGVDLCGVGQVGSVGVTTKLGGYGIQRPARPGHEGEMCTSIGELLGNGFSNAAACPGDDNVSPLQIHTLQSRICRGCSLLALQALAELSVQQQHNDCTDNGANKASA